MNMKKYSQAPAKGFTLVELIVVIVILAILATIAFLSFGSQSAAARDSKRKTDLSNLASKMNIAMANGTTVLGLVTSVSSQQVTTPKIAWTWAVVWTDYNAWTINFNVLGVAAWDFKDADGSNTYKIGATSNAGSAFQLAATLENDNAGNPGKNGFVVGNYSARTYSWSISLSNYSSWSTTLSLPSWSVGMFKKWDWINLINASSAVIGTWYITNVSSDLGTVTFNAWFALNTGSGIRLITDEVSWLVASSASGSQWVVNWSTVYYPY